MSYGSSTYGVDVYGGDSDTPITTDTLPVACLEWEPVVGSNAWVNVTSYLRNNSVSINRGRGSESDQFRAGTMQLTMNNRAREWDPEYSGNVSPGNLRPNRRIRFSETFNGTTYPLFTGFIDRFEQSYDYPREAVTLISATDAFKVLQGAHLPVSVYQAEVLLDHPALWFKLDEPAGSTLAFDTTRTRDLPAHSDLDLPEFGAAGIVARDPGTGMQEVPDNAGFSEYGPFPVTTAPMTIELCYQHSPGGGTGLLAGFSQLTISNNAAYIGVGSGEVFEVTFNSNGGTTRSTVGSNITDELPHHIVFVWQADGLHYIYVDGIQGIPNPQTLAPATFSTEGWVFIGGGYLPFSTDGAEGIYQHVAFYDYALSEARITAHYEAMRWAGTDSVDLTPITTDRTAGQWAGDIAAERIDHVLDTINFPDADRDLSGALYTTITDAAWNSGLNVLASATANFDDDCVGRSITGANIPAGAIIESISIFGGSGSVTSCSIGTVPAFTFPSSLSGQTVTFTRPNGSLYQATDLGGSLLAYCQKVEETEGGRFFVSAAGKVTFRGRRDAWKPPYSVSTYTFGDLAPELPYSSLGLFLDESTIVNQSRVSRVDGVIQISNDGDSQDEFFQRNGDHTDLLNNSDTESRDHANFITSTLADPVNKLPSLEVSPRRDPSNLYPALLGLEIGTRLTVRRRPQGVGSMIQKEVIVEGINHKIGSKMHEVTLYVSELDAIKVWLLDDPVNSVLDTTTRLGY